MEIKIKKYRFKRKNLKKPNKSKDYIRRIFKIIFTLIMIIIVNFLYFKPIKQTEQINNNNNWIKKNMTEYINNYLSVFKGDYKNAKTDIDYIEKYLPLKVIIKEGNLTLNLETIEELKKELKRKTRKDFGLVRNIFITDTVKFGNQIISFNNLIYYCEILGIKNIYLNSRIDWYIKNDIDTDKIHISVKPRNEVKCSNYETFCTHIVRFFFSYNNQI